jgi:sugar phosphate isomerase/epimerase
MKYALFTVSSPTVTLEELAPQLQALGYDGWELRVVDEPPNPKGMEFWHGNKSTVPASTFGGEVARIKALSEKHSLQLPNLGTYVRSNDDWADIERAVANAVAIGAPSLRINVPQYSSDQPFMPIWNQAREDFKRIEQVAAQNNVRALIEVHMGTICPSASAARMFVDGMDPKHIGVIHDAGNMVYEGFENYRLGLEMLGDYLALVHVKNATAYPFKTRPDTTVEWRFKFWPMHQGVADIRALIVALLDIGYDGWISFEDFSTQQKLPDRMKFNIEFVKRLVEEETAKRQEATTAT